jgi:hypothetical protein
MNSTRPGYDRLQWADTAPTVVASGTPAIDVQRSFRSATVDVAVEDGVRTKQVRVAAPKTPGARPKRDSPAGI